MNWSHVDVFKEHLRAYQARTGKTQQQVAEELGTTYGTLRFWLAGTRPPKNENLKRAAVLFGCSVTEFIDDPGAPPPGVDAERWAKATERDRVLASAMFEELVDVPEDLKDTYISLYKQGVFAAMVRMAIENKGKK